MEIYKNFPIKKWILLMSLFITGCSISKDIFPSDSEHYPLANYIIINDEKIKLCEDENWLRAEYTYIIDETKEFTIQLPEMMTIARWTIQTDNVEVIESQRIINNSPHEYIKEGTSPYIQRFTIKNSDDIKQIEFDLINIDNVNKTDQYVDYYRSLIIYISKSR